MSVSTRALPLLRLTDQLGQVVIGLRPDDDVDAGRAARDLGAFGLGDAAGDRDHRLDAAGAVQHPADLGIDLLGRFLADMAGVEHDEVGLVAVGGRGHAFGLEQLGHALAVIDIHLAAERLDLESPGIPVLHCAPYRASHPGPKAPSASSNLGLRPGGQSLAVARLMRVDRREEAQASPGSCPCATPPASH